MRADEARLRMPHLEHHPEREYTMADFLAWLLSLDDEDIDDVSAAMLTEVHRARLLATRHYHRFASRVYVGDVTIDCAVAFMQGACFAAAALGVEPEGEPGHE